MWDAIFVASAATLVVAASYLSLGLLPSRRRDATPTLAPTPTLARTPTPTTLTPTPTPTPTLTRTRTFTPTRVLERPLAIQDFDLRELIEQIADRSAVRAHAKGVSFVADVPPQVPTHLRADVGDLERVLVNLTGNAVELTDTGSVTLHVRPIRCSGVNVKLRFAVTDTGAGLATERVAALLASRTRTDGGAGLGVALSEALIVRMGGRMGIESEVGTGTMFWFEITLARQADVASDTHVTTSLRGCKILVVDDDWRCRGVVKQQLRAWGCNVLEATSALDAILHLAACGANDPFDLVLMDLVMPEMGGIEASRAIRANPVLRVVPIVLMTSLGIAVPHEATREHGFAAVITKPVRHAALLRAVQIAIGRPEGDSHLQAAG